MFLKCHVTAYAAEQAQANVEFLKRCLDLQGALLAEEDFVFLKLQSLLRFQTFRLLHEEGFYVGASSGLNVTAAVRVARDMGPGHTVVTCLCDTGQRYFTRLYSRTWLEGKNLLDAIPEKYRHSLIE